MNLNHLTTSGLIIAMCCASFTVHAKDDRVRMQCRAVSSDGVLSMKARFRERVGKRARFKASFEAAPGIGYRPDDVLQVRIDDNLVGWVTLDVKANGDIGGEMKFDTNIDRDEPDTTQGFPANWPGVDAGTIVEVGAMGCSLQHR